jgi:hypothetical protein
MHMKKVWEAQKVNPGMHKDLSGAEQQRWDRIGEWNPYKALHKMGEGQ